MCQHLAGIRFNPADIFFEWYPQNELSDQHTDGHNEAVDGQIIDGMYKAEDGNDGQDFGDDGTQNGEFEFFESEVEPADIEESAEHLKSHDRSHETVFGEEADVTGISDTTQE